MIDLAIGAITLALVIRGWIRGLARQAIDLAALIAGVVIAFRLSGAVGSVIQAMAGTSATVSRLIAGGALFIAVTVAAYVVSRIIHVGIRLLPGLPLLNRAGGAALGGLWAILIATVVLSVLAVVPMPVVLAAEMDRSLAAEVLTDPDAPVQKAIAGLAGDRVLQSSIEIRRLFDHGRIVVSPGERIEIPPADDVLVLASDGERMFDLLNRFRVAAGMDPLSWSPVLAAIAEAQAQEMYRAGLLTNDAGDNGSVEESLREAGIPFVAAGRSVALAPNPEEAHDGFSASAYDAALMASGEFNRAGVGVVAGPTGLIVVQILSG